MVENIFRQKQWKIFSTKIAGKYFPVEKVFHRADEFSLNVEECLSKILPLLMLYSRSYFPE